MLSDCVGVVPIEHAEVFLESLRKFAPAKRVSGLLALHDGYQVCELWVSPRFSAHERVRWGKLWWKLREESLSRARPGAVPQPEKGKRSQV